MDSAHFIKENVYRESQSAQEEFNNEEEIKHSKVLNELPSLLNFECIPNIKRKKNDGPIAYQWPTAAGIPS